MSAHVHREEKNISSTLSVIRLSGGRLMRLILRPRKRISALLATLLAAWLPQFSHALDVNVLPTQGSVKVGSGQISQSGANMVISQGSARLGLDWQTFNIGANGSVTYIQPGKDAVALNRVVGNEASQIFGRLSANGQVFLVNPNGVLFAPGSKVDVGGLVASTLSISQENFAKGKYEFVAVDKAGKVINQGSIQGSIGGYVALFAPQVKNEGSINVPAGHVVLAGGRAVTVDITGSGLINAVITQGAENSSVENSGTLSAQGGTVRMTAKAAHDTVGGLVNNTGIIKANTLVNKGGEIWLVGDSVSTVGEVRAEGATAQAGGATATTGGLIHVEAASVALGGSLSVDGAGGGRIEVSAGQRLSLADKVSARGLSAQGGQVVYTSGGGILEAGSSSTDASGATDGGEISVNAASGVASSGNYSVAGRAGVGGRIDVSGHSVHLLSAELDASGIMGGGRIRIGGEFQGGKLPVAPDSASTASHLFVRRWEDSVALASADTTFINDSTSLNVGGGLGLGGTAIVWANTQTTFIGSIDARGAAGGGAVEISAGDTLKRAALDRVQIGTGGQLLLDPKNIIIGNADALKQWQYQGVLESIYSWKASVPVLGNYDYLGYSVALSSDATLMAVGAVGDDGAAGSRTDAGAVHLFAFQDTSFGGGALVGTIGDGYLGGKNINVTLDASDEFGSAVALSANGQALAVGARYDNGFGNLKSNTGAVHLFTFSDTGFGGGLKVGTMGSGYVGTGDVNVSLDNSDHFGSSVALSGTGTRLVVGAPLDDGVANNKYDSGAVHLFGFGTGFTTGAKLGTIGNDYAGASDVALGQSNYDYLGSGVAISRDGTSLAVGAQLDDGASATSGDFGAVHLFTLDTAFKPAKVGTIGVGYSGGNNINVGLDVSDHFGYSLAINGDGTRLAIGAYADDGANNSNGDSGAVRLFKFTGTGFVGGSHVATLGSGYDDNNDADVSLRGSNYFGVAVAMSSDATRLAVGAHGDSGAKNNLYQSGAVHLFTFTDSSFGGGEQAGSVGQDYRNERGQGVALDGSRSNLGNDYAGTSVSLNSNARLLAVGAPGDDGYGDNATDTGAVHLITFADGDFGGAALAGTVGHGYIGGKNVDVKLGNNDQFGFGVALSGDGLHLAAGAWLDDGATNINTDAGAVHLFSFNDSSFGGGFKVGTIGAGYTGLNDVNLTLGNSDRFGVSAALSSDGTRLAAGAYLDSGASDNLYQSGAVHLFSFGAGFAGGSKVGTIGSGYTTTLDPDNVDVSLDYYDYFGVSVALSADGKKLAVGAYGDDGAANANSDTGAVHLFSFTEATGAFTGGSKVGTMGSDYTTALAAGNVDVTLGNSDYFGRGLALNGTGSLLAVGAPYDDGAGNARTNSGAVHLFTFTNTNFGGGALAGTVGDGYTGGRNVDVRLDNSDYFGNALALNAVGDRMVVGAPNDDGASNAAADSGAVHLFTFSDAAFNGGRLAGHIGNGYTPVNSLAVDLFGNKSWNGDQAGYAVALGSDARQLVIGAPSDDGNLENPWSNGNYGAVHLLTFSDGNYAGGTLVGTIGKGYTGGKNVDVALDKDDNFGSAVALSGDGKHLAVGSRYDDGFNNGNRDSGAVHLFTFADTAFAGGQKTGAVGSGYADLKDVNVSLDAYDYFGASVALNQDGTLLATGVTGDDSSGLSGNYGYEYGAVHLFSFNADFAGGAKVGTIGSGYTTAADPDNVPVSLDYYENFGQSVALNSAGTLLAVGAPQNRGKLIDQSYTGAVRLFTFGASFTGGSHTATLGYGFDGTNDTALALGGSDNFGQSVALNSAGTLLAVGATGDDGANNSYSSTGAVHLFTLDNGFKGTLAGTVGSGYTGGKNVEAGVASSDGFGGSVALNGAGDRLAVGAPTDDGADNARTDSGAVHLFSFADSAFSGGKLQARVGSGYKSEASLALNLVGSKSWNGDQAGSAVALSSDARQLAIGAPYDDAGNLPAWTGGDFGAVHLVTFTDGSFGGGALAGTVGKGYSGGKNIDLALDANDNFGTAVALSGDGKHLAVGVPNDDGFNNAKGSSGAVHLFTFTDTAFAGGQRKGTIGSGYVGVRDTALSLDNSDNFGSSVALNNDGTRLAAGARYDDGFNNTVGNSGAVHLFTFADASFGGGAKLGTIGSGYVGTGDVNVTMDGSDHFGWSVALNADGSRLAVGAPRDHGFGNTHSYSGAVHLFTFADTSFGSGQKTGTVGRGYAGAGDVNVALDSSDQFGSGLALSADATRLVVGAPYDSGVSNFNYYTGAVRTLTFASGFTSGTQVGIIGSGYSGTHDLAVSNSNYSYFGSALALSGDATRMAMGVPYDRGANLNLSESGAVQLFTFGAGLTSPAKVGTVGNGYTGPASLNLSFTGYGNSSGEKLGSAVALSADAKLLAIGLPGDVGADLQSPLAGVGAVHLVRFTDGNFGGASLAGSIGSGYSGGNNVNVSLDKDDNFGAAVALSRDGLRLAVGAPNDDGATNALSNSGAVHLFKFANTSFGSGQQVGTIGSGYAGVGSLDVTLNASDAFGQSLALNADGTRLAVGAGNYYDYGSVRLFTLDSNFLGASQVATLGNGLTGASSINVSSIGYYDQFGSALALSGDGKRLAVGASGDDGALDAAGDSGAVHLFTFGAGFTGGVHIGAIGAGYGGIGHIDVALDNSDAFGSAVALSADGNRLAVGASYDDGGGQGTSNSGAVRLFSFNDSFAAGTQIATVGSGYSGGKDVHIKLDSSDYFGSSIALNGDGSRMAVGAPGDNGANNTLTDPGVMHLFSFADTNFSGGQRVGSLGQGYVPVAQAVDMALVGSGSGSGDQFGTSVALSSDARQMAVGAPNDVGANKAGLASSQGAVHLITFADGNFGGAQVVGTIGSGYTGGNNVAVSLDADDYFGTSVALSRDGKALAVGAPNDDGANNSRTDSGAVRLFTFADTAFAGGQQAATLGYGYGGTGNNLSVALDTSDGFGQSVALNSNGTRLAVGTPYDDGASQNYYYDYGAVHLFTFGAGFQSGAKTGTIGAGYSGVGNVDVALDSSDYLGWSVALNADATLLAAGAPQDDGQSQIRSNAGAVHLFSLGDAFVSGTKVAAVGAGYTGGNNLAVNLSNSDNFGKSVALSADGTKMAVGVPRDDGAYDTQSNTGAIELFTFGAGFTSGTKVGTIGADYAGGKDINFNSSNSDGSLGWSVAVNGDASRLAAGLLYDDGIRGNLSDAGAVKLFSFTDANFAGGKAAGTLGAGYQAAANSASQPWASSVSYSGDAFGAAVAFDATGNLLAVGAPGDDGFRNGNRASGAVYLFQFGGSGNARASLLGTVGTGYTGGKNVNVSLDAGDGFGKAVALSATGTRLAVGAHLDDGSGNVVTDSGAVHLFSFTDTAFSGGAQSGSIGYGYTGSGSLAVNTLDYVDQFGSAVAFSANASLLAVGAPLDKGVTNAFSNASYGYGAVHLFQSANSTWSKTGTLGYGYSGAGSLDMIGSMPTNRENFGAALAMSADGSVLAVGAPFNYGYNYAAYDSGAVHLFTMGSSFATPAKVGTIGLGYVANLTDTDTTNDRHLAVSTLSSSDYFGSALALTADGMRLAVGTPGDDGGDVTVYDSGAVHLFSFADTSFGTPARLSSLGVGYSAVGDLQSRMAGSDAFGSAVAFNADGTRLAVGSPRDDGASNSKTDSGSVRVFTFTDTTTYAQGFELTALGSGRLPGNVSFPLVTTNDQFGAAVALSSDSTRLAVGAPGDDGLSNDRADSGAVHLFSFTDTNFAGAALEGTIGFGYTGGKSRSVELGWGDKFGSALAFNATATQLAVGAPYDDGAGNDRTDSGAVHLFTFTDGSFSGGSKTGTMGYGYAGTGNVNVATLDANDHFGSSVGLSSNGQRLVVGAPGDDGSSNYNSYDYGAVHRFTFTDSAFSGGALAGTIGSGYTGSGNVNLALDSSDNFGQSVALNGDATLLAVGSPGDDGYNNSNNYYYYYGYSTGAVHLFKFADASFGAPTKTGTIGLGYVGLGDVSQVLDYNDRFGSALALNSVGTVLAVGSPYDSGQANANSQSGSVSLFGFSDSAFGGGKLSNTLGHGYNSIGQVPVTLSANDYFGSAVALNGTGDQMAVGLPGRDSTGGYTLSDTGGVYLFKSTTIAPATDLTTLTYAGAQSSTSAVSVSDLAATLAAGTSVTLQANNDLMLASSLAVTGTTGGNLSLLAGRRILLEGDITTANGNLSVKANAPVADGVVAAERDSGAAVITMDSGTSINAGTGVVALTLGNGAGLTNSTSGDITLGGIIASSVTVENLGPTAGSDIRLNGPLATTGDIVVATTAGNFVNNVGATALSSSAGRWLVYTGDWGSSTENGLVGAAGGTQPRLYSQTYAVNPPASVTTGNHVLYRSQPTATLYVNNAAKVYGDAEPTLSYSAYGLISDDGVTDTFQTAGITDPTLSLPTLADTTRRAAGNHAISISTTQTGTNAGYAVNIGDGATLTVSQKQLTLVDLSVSDKTYDGNTSAMISSTGSISGLLTGDAVLVDSSAVTAAFANARAGNGKTVNIAGMTLTGSDAGNYSVSNLSTTANIARKSVTLTSFSAQDKTYDGGVTATIASYGALTGLIGTETLVLGGGNARFADKNAGAGKTVTLSNVALNNGTGLAGDYFLSSNFPSTTASIQQKAISASGTRVYDGSAAVAAVSLNLLGTIGGDIVSLQGAGSTADKHIGTAKAVTLDTLALQGTDAVNYALDGGTLTVTPKPLSVTGMSVQNRVYDGTTTANYTGTPTLGGNLIAGDDATLTTSALSVAFVDKNADFNKPLVATGLSLTGSDAPNYNIVVGDTATIAPRALSVSAIGQSKVYDGTRAATATYSDNRITGDVFTVNGNAQFDSKNVGVNKPISISLNLAGADALNYLPNTTVATSADVTARVLTLAPVASTKVYDRSTVATISFEAGSDNRVAGDSLTLEALASFADRHVGTAKAVTGTIAVTGADAGNYSFDTALNLSADITAKPLIANGSRVYDGSAAVAATDLDLAGVISGDTVTLSGAGSMADKRVGEQKAVTPGTLAIAGADAGNYMFNSATIDITPMVLNVSGLTAQDKVYDGTKAAVASGTPVLSGTIIGTDDVTVVPTPSITVEFSDKNAGQAKTLLVAGGLITGVDAENYQVVVQGTASIAKRDLVLTATANDKVYDGTRLAIMTVGSDKISTDNLIVTAEGTFVDKNVAASKPVSVAMAVTGTDALNYTYTPVTSSEASITARPLTITATAAGRIYNGLTNAEVTLADNRVESDVITMVGVGSFADKNVGIAKPVSVALTLGGADLGNYSTSTSVETTADITPKMLIFSNLTVGDKIYDGTVNANISGDFSVASGLIAGDVVVADTSAATANFADKNAGANKSISVSGVLLSGTDKDNYSVASTAGAATIFKKTIDVRGLTPDSKVYDGTRSATVSGTPDITASFVSGDDVALNVGNFAVEFEDKNVGTAKPLYVAGNLLTGTDAVNYDALLNTTANITARPLTVTATALDKTYDGTTVATVNLTDNRITGDVLSLAGTGAFADKNVDAGKSVSISGFSVTGVDASNYSYGTTDFFATASINPKTILATGSRVYDGTTAMPADTFGFAGVIEGDLLALGGSVALLDKHVGANKAMNGTLLLEGADSQNYILSGMQYGVTPKALTVSGLTATSKVYDGTTAATAAGTPTIGLELVTGDEVTADLSTINVAFLNKNVGSAKALQVTGNVLSGADAANYQPILSATADITAKQLTITGVGADNKEYDGTTTATRLTTGTPALSGGIINGDDFAVDISNLAVAFADKNAGTGKALVVAGASMTGLDAGNYLVSVQNATADITPKVLTATVTAPDKVYDGSTTAAPTLSISAGLVGSETVSATGTASFNSKDVLTANLVTVNSTALVDGRNGGLASNYSLAAGQTAAASITAKALSVTVTATNKVYDGSTTAAPTLSISAGLVGLETVSATGTASFNSKDVLAANLVTVSSTALANGSNAGLASNYSLAAGQTVAASITTKALIATVTAPNKVYDGSTTAAPTLSISAGDLVGSETVSATGTASFNSKDVRTANLVTVDSVTVADGGSGSAAGLASNYQLAAGQTVEARITPAPLTVTADNKERQYGDANPVFSYTLTGFVTGENLETSGVTGSASGATTAALTSPIGGYSISPTPGSLSAQNYMLQSFVSGSLTVTPRPLIVTANDVVRLAGENDPNPFEFSTGQGGLVSSDTLASVSIAAPVGSAKATGGEVLNLVPRGATFASGQASNYDINYVDGYLIVVPKPADLAKDNTDVANTAFFVELDPQEIALVRNELQNQQTQLLSPQRSTAQMSQTPVSSKDSQAEREPNDIRRIAEQLSQTAQLDSVGVLNTLRSEPLVLWHPALLPRLLQMIGRNE